MPCVLLIEDDPDTGDSIKAMLELSGHDVLWARHGREAMGLLQHSARPDVILTDILMPEIDWKEAARQIRTLEAARGVLSTYGAKIIMTTAVNDMKEVIRSFQELCDAYLCKPIDTAELLGHLRTFRLVK